MRRPLRCEFPFFSVTRPTGEIRRQAAHTSVFYSCVLTLTPGRTHQRAEGLGGATAEHFAFLLSVAKSAAHQSERESGQSWSQL